MRLVALALVALSLYPAIGEDEAADVQVDCGPTSVGIATECTATITLAGGTASTSETDPPRSKSACTTTSRVGSPRPPSL